MAHTAACSMLLTVARPVPAVGRLVDTDGGSVSSRLVIAGVVAARVGHSDLARFLRPVNFPMSAVCGKSVLRRRCRKECKP